MAKPKTSVMGTCFKHPSETGQPHESMETERRCVYCGLSLKPYGCNGCGRFLSASEMSEGYRCKACR